MFCYGVTLGIKWRLHTGDIDLAVQVITSGKKPRIDLERVLQEAGAISFFSSSDGLIRFSIPDYRIEFIEDEKLLLVTKAQKIGKETKRKIQSSCEIIPFPYERLGI